MEANKTVTPQGAIGQIRMRATIDGTVSGRPLWRVQDAKNVYRVFDGRYTLDRFTPTGNRTTVSVMHDRYKGLRARIDAAIKARVTLAKAGAA